MIKSLGMASVPIFVVALLGLANIRPAVGVMAAATWQRAALIYDSPGRTALQWEQHLMRVSAAGQFTGQWLFDSVVVTTQAIDGQDIVSASLTGQQLTDLLTQEFSDAAALDSAAAALAAAYGAPPRPVQVAIALPWLSPQDKSVTAGGATYDLSVPAQRMSVTTWYLNQVKSMAASARWSQLSLDGIYYQREDASSA